jgi:hypothetical protein
VTPNVCEHRSIERFRIQNGIGETVSLSWHCDECGVMFGPRAPGMVRCWALVQRPDSDHPAYTVVMAPEGACAGERLLAGTFVPDSSPITPRSDP